MRQSAPSALYSIHDVWWNYLIYLTAASGRSPGMVLHVHDAKTATWFCPVICLLEAATFMSPPGGWLYAPSSQSLQWGNIPLQLFIAVSLWLAWLSDQGLPTLPPALQHWCCYIAYYITHIGTWLYQGKRGYSQNRIWVNFSHCQPTLTAAKHMVAIYIHMGSLNILQLVIF